MKRKALILVAVTVLLSLVTIGNGLCQFSGVAVGVLNYKHHPILGNKLLLHITLPSSQSFSPIYGVRKMTAQNADPTLDPSLYVFPLTPYTHSLTCEWLAVGEFNNQTGYYEVTIERQDLDPVVLRTEYLDPSQLVPYHTPENLRVSFENGLGTPTLTSDPIPGFDPATNWKQSYRIRIYDEDYTRVIYDAPGLPSPRITFPEGRCFEPGCKPSTGEDLIPGERYIFRVEAVELFPSPGYLFNAASSFVTFRVPRE